LFPAPSPPSPAAASLGEGSMPGGAVYFIVISSSVSRHASSSSSRPAVSRPGPMKTSSWRRPVA
jgi:hypothetical protein